MIKRFFLDRLVKWGTPWHGKLLGSTLHLPNSTTMAGPGDSQYAAGGDYIKVQVPGHPAAETTEAEAAEGKEWKSCGIIAGANHLFYGKVLGERAWLYVAPEKSLWLVSLTFPTATAEITFKRFGMVNKPPASVAQTVQITPGWTTVKSLDVIQDVSPQGNKVLWSHRDTNAAAARASRSRETMLQGVTLLTISGTPPNASATWAVLKTESECAGSVSDTLYTNATEYYSIGSFDEEEVYIDGPSIRCHSRDVSWPTSSGYDVDPVEAPGGSGFPGFCQNTFQCAPVSYGENMVMVVTEMGGEKNVSGAIGGACFSDSGGVSYITVDAAFGDTRSSTDSMSVDTYEDGHEVWIGQEETADFSRSGSIQIKRGGAAFVDISLVAEFSAGFDNNNWECTSLNYGIGDFFTDTNASHYALYFGGASGGPPNGFDVQASNTHIVVDGWGGDIGPYGASDRLRLIPARYANHCYGFIGALGPGVWSISPTWSEGSGTVTEDHKAFSANGSSSVAASWAGDASGSAGSQHAFASSNKDTNEVAISTSENVCYI